MSIYIAFHQECFLPCLRGYVPIQVGAALHPLFSFMTDAEKLDNISFKNPNFCELTALYYIWKNRSDRVVGLTHYRRYFLTKRPLAPDAQSSLCKRLASFEELSSVLDAHTIVLPEKHFFTVTAYKQYEICHCKEDMDLCREVISELTPEYLEAFDQAMQEYYLYNRNMFVMTRKNYDNYMQWLFTILFALEKRVDLSTHDAYNKRIFGFISERMLNVWLTRQELSVVEYPLCEIDTV